MECQVAGKQNVALRLGAYPSLRKGELSESRYVNMKYPVDSPTTAMPWDKELRSHSPNP